MSALDTVDSTVKTGKSILSTAWKVARTSATITGAFAFAAVVIGGGPAVAVTSLSTYAALPIEGVTEVAQKLGSGMQALAGMLPAPTA